MLGWNEFIWFGTTAIALAAASSVTSLYSCRKAASGLAVAAIVALLVFITGLWVSLGRPPMRTTGETRLWYSFFALISGLATYRRWGYKWIIPFSTVLASVFILLNILKPEIHDETLMPALQSPWFIPHVTVYMFSYSLLGCAFLIAVVTLFKGKEHKDLLASADTLVYIGTAFLTFGMLSGAIWAKQAWGHYWSWDPKETWALITWMCYVLYMHLRFYMGKRVKLLCILLIFAFACLQMCWWGVNLLPSAADSMHVY
ncbi:MAG: cytochrome c biogenesis protein CcsA [Bacteroidales bacterium]|nr:cytochrome c biogenesis protein CcsA [Bacteroidales bacterium]